jgi:hypothetical protein
MGVIDAGFSVQLKLYDGELMGGLEVELAVWDVKVVAVE